MSPEKRRAMIVQAVLPLFVEHGAAVTTSQIARAAGIGEATVFRAFTDKDELLDACVAEALRPDNAVAGIQAIPLDVPLEDRLVEAAGALAAHMERMGALFGALRSSGYKRERGPAPKRGRVSDDLREAVAELFEPESDSLRLPPQQLAAMFTGLLMMRGRLGEEKPSIEAMIDVLLHGAVR
ncbi:TetR/AcrR family transcriptional regulator [Kibdelosporangium philippinense]|uniref:TetR/AcrR family transcriptional regulator n=1 Tax=Kibdelosporangium philippinense TaxID=211113 RepID=A0ABS8ZXT5_9PSEU|nr:TetR/AcrR family transcriptional regulator [Kibdelosporangium philippinense]MCE7010797.1 TetR/AcrR family transcriptional regulator [Kibdelosporangium philippinense]